VSLPNIIAVTAPSRRSGKGTVADVLITRFGYTKFQYALSLKTAFVALCMAQGIEQDRITRMLDGDLKEAPQAEIGGLSLRTFCEGVGTDWGRKTVSEDLWVNMAYTKIVKLLDSGHRVVVEDARFVNECNLVRELGGKVIRVVRPEYNGGLPPTLSSEGHLESYPVDFIFANEASVERLREQVADWARSL
jgi:hypothetical protein